MNSQKAFTLIELLITIAILGILVAIAYPIYSNHLIKTRRVQASQNLLLISQALEIYHSEHRQYTGAKLNQLTPNIIAHQTHYHYTINELTEQSYVLMATPTYKDTQCGKLTLDQLGEKGHSGTMSLQTCWLT